MQKIYPIPYYILHKPCIVKAIKTILENMVPLVDQSSNLRLEVIGSDTDEEEVDFQVIFSFQILNVYFP